MHGLDVVFLFYLLIVGLKSAALNASYATDSLIPPKYSSLSFLFFFSLSPSPSGLSSMFTSSSSAGGFLKAIVLDFRETPGAHCYSNWAINAFLLSFTSFLSSSFFKFDAFFISRSAFSFYSFSSFSLAKGFPPIFRTEGTNYESILFGSTFFSSSFFSSIGYLARDLGTITSLG